MKKLHSIAAIGVLAALASCGSKSQWGIDGKIEGLAENQSVVIEGVNQGSWYLIDTLKIDKKGKFSYRHDPQGYPDVYRLRLGNEAVYFPIDSVETVNIHAEASSFASGKRSGSVQASNMAYVDSLINASVSAIGVEATITDESLKRKLGEMIIGDPAGIVSYYIVSKQIDGKPLFSAGRGIDKRLIGAVANAYSSRRPSDPRTSYLTRLFLSSRQPKQTTATIEAAEIGAPEISLFDQTGKEQSLNAVIGKGDVVLVNFTAYEAQDAPAFNVILADIYKKYHSAGLEIYQVSVDDNEYRWREAAKNLPWITVLSPAHDATALSVYNVTSIPTSFIIDRTGQIVERIEDPSKLASAVARYM